MYIIVPSRSRAPRGTIYKKLKRYIEWGYNHFPNEWGCSLKDVSEETLATFMNIMDVPFELSGLRRLYLKQPKNRRVLLCKKYLKEQSNEKERSAKQAG